MPKFMNHICIMAIFSIFLKDFCNRQPVKDLHGSDSEKLYFEIYAHSKIICMDIFFSLSTEENISSC